MSATDALTDAGSLTKRYLSALWLQGLLKLGLVIMFLGGSFVIFQLVSAPFNPETIDDPAELWNFAWLFAAGIGIFAAFRYLAAVLEFVFVTSLRTEQLALQRYLRNHLSVGLWLVLFRAFVAVGALSLVAVAVVIIVGTDPVAFETATSQQGIAIAATVILAAGGWLVVDTLTTGFVIPIMQHTRCGPLRGWRRFFSAMTSNWIAVVAFLLLAWALGFALWIVLVGIGFAVTFFGSLLLILIAIGLTELHSTFEPVVIVLFIAGIIGYQYAVSLVKAPVRSYVRYYALVVLGESDSELDLIGNQRASLGGDTEASPTYEAVSTSAENDTPDSTDSSTK